MSEATNCIFCRIIRKELPARILFEDEDILAFHDIHPVRPVHFLIIPKVHIATLYDTAAGHVRALGRMLEMAGTLARQAGADEGFRTIVNCGRVGQQEVYHLHMHVIGGPEPLGPMVMRTQ